MIKEKIEELYRKSKDKEKIAFYATDAGKCPRQIWFSLKGYNKKPTEPRVMRIFENGNYTHMRILSALFSLGIVTAVEVNIPEDKLIHGRADAIISIDGKPNVVEIKSVNTTKFKKEEPDADHIKQIQLYLHFFNIKDGILLYENKNTQELKEFIIKYDPRLVKKLLAFFEDLKEKVEKNIIPEVPKDIEDWRCKYCPYKEECEKLRK